MTIKIMFSGVYYVYPHTATHTHTHTHTHTLPIMGTFQNMPIVPRLLIKLVAGRCSLTKYRVFWDVLPERPRSRLAEAFGADSRRQR